ncbi:MAG: hypothetical protein U0441_24890 [Polyangiaceae bacterium]
MFALSLGLITASCGGTASESSGSNGTGGSTTSTAGAGGTAGTGGTTTTLTKTCEEPTVLTQGDGSESGFVKCKDGSTNREKSVACQLVPASDSCEPGPSVFGNCKTAADCVAHPNGTCQADAILPASPPTCSCAYQCQSDADCDAGQVCGCGYNGGWPHCIAAPSCKESADCPSGECGLSYYTNGCTMQYNLACRTAADECRVIDDCAPTGSVCSQTMATGSWTCSSYNCTL